MEMGNILGIAREALSAWVLVTLVSQVVNPWLLEFFRQRCQAERDDRLAAAALLRGGNHGEKSAGV